MGILASTKVKETEFDVFGLNINDGPVPAKHYFLITIIGLNAFLVIFTFFNLYFSGFKLTKKIGYIFLGIYFVYFILALAFGILTRGQ